MRLSVAAGRLLPDDVPFVLLGVASEQGRPVEGLATTGEVTDEPLRRNTAGAVFGRGGGGGASSCLLTVLAHFPAFKGAWADKQ